MFTQPGAVFAPPAPAAPTGPPVFEHPPTSEQANILDAAATGRDLVIEAGAGTGKTSTLKMVAAARPDHRMLYLAYNRAIAQDAAASFPASVQCSTAHSLAFRAVGHAYQHRLNGPRVPARETARILRIPAVLDLGAKALTSVKVARVVMDAVAAFCHSSSDTPAWWNIHQIPGLEREEMTRLRQQVLPMVDRAWEDLTRPDGRLRFTHDVYLKLWALAHPELPADVVMLDEAQDANPVIAALVDEQGSQRILVGDESQAIYGWRGAVDAMASFDGARLRLSQSFRFGQQIADEANEWLQLLNAPLRLTGNPAMNSRLERIPAPAAVLCRTNAGAVGQVIAALGAGHRPALVGGGDDIRRLAKACQDLRTGRGTEHPELMAFASWQEVQDYAEHDSGGQDLKVFIKLIDGHGPERIMRLVDQLVTEDAADVVISTAHKAKGREWSTVRLAADFPPPYDPVTGQLVSAEAMLTYVAVTRAREALDCHALSTKGGQETTTAAEPTLFDVLVPDPEPIETDLPADLVGWFNLAREARMNKARWAEVEAAAAEKIKDHLAARGLDEATVGGRPAVSWKTSKPGYQLDAKALQADHPEIYEAYLKAKSPARPFKLLGD
ncbi:UvrD-helicase domain-containing protein [Planomonospora sp. ID67723]|uniref:UvrD-helicase domain-containing protein n=1 Tax=Planomonospora sp. ID67723 TaxID=2738134 RepID=UPI001A35A3B2|nr:UvrD-helicase domain-containing protein [Planomonospora sp. ID67723]MBG0830537.1 UvrD-helicase domain-containing protein [Planomonospora sp. ID67723]